MTAPKQAADRADEIARDAVSGFCKQVGVSRGYLSQGDWLEQRIAAAIRSAEPQWRYDMENAPRDGDDILAWTPNHLVMLARWAGIDTYGGASWWSNGVPIIPQPVAWMPLPASPAPPEAISGKETGA